MHLDTLANLSTIIQTALIFISLVFIAYQLQQANKLAKANNIQAISAQAASFNSLLYQDEKLCQLWYGKGRNLDGDLIGQQRYRELLGQWFILHENIYYQKKQGLFDDNIYKGWYDDLENIIKHHDPRVVQDITQYVYGDFKDHIVKLQQEVEKQSQIKNPRTS